MPSPFHAGYETLLSDIQTLVAEARRQAARTVNAVLTRTYWEIGRRIVHHEQRGRPRAMYGEQLLKRLSLDLSSKYGRGFSERNLEQMRQFYLQHPYRSISQTASAKSFPLSWSHYARIMQVRNPRARPFYEAEALRGGWSIRQLDRQIESQFYERTALSRNKKAVLLHGGRTRGGDAVSPEEELKDPYILEFLNLKDEYSESELEEALIRHLESFLLELGGDFAFVSRQKRLRVGDAWYRVDLVFFHRKLRCLVLIDLKLGRFNHSDAGQMHLYLNYAREHWTNRGENPPVGLILCAEKDSAVAHYALEGLSNKILAAEYKTKLPKERELERELERTQQTLAIPRPIK